MFGRKKKSTNPFDEEPSAPPASSQWKQQESSNQYPQRYPSSASQTPPPSYRSQSQSDISEREQLFGNAPSRSRFQGRNQYNSSESGPASESYGGRDRYNNSTSQYGRPGYDEQGQQDAYSSSKWGEDEADQEVGGLKQQIRNVKQDTLASSRNAVQKIREAEEAAGNTMNMLGEQSCKYNLSVGVSVCVHLLTYI
jgi:hypothetical protein